MTLSISHISKTYKNGTVKALDDVSLDLTPGVYGLLGPNGAGKSTLMNIIADNIKPDAGNVCYDGQPTVAMGRDFRDKLGYMPQQQGLYDEFTANRFLWYFSALKGMTKAQAKPKIEQLLQMVNLRQDAYKKLGAFSGGMKQRILIAQSLLNDPKVLMLDEPTAGLDPKERVRIRNFISEIALERIVLLATHVVSDIEYIAKEVIFLGGGRLMMQGSPGDVLARFSDKVWQAHIQTSELKTVQGKYIVSNIFGEKDGLACVKIIADACPRELGAEAAMPTLEDVYLYLFQDAEAEAEAEHEFNQI